MILEILKRIVQDAVQELFDHKIDPPTFDIVPDRQSGDLCFNAFLLARSLKKSPQDITSALAERVGRSRFINDACGIKGFLNLTLSSGKCLEIIIEDTLSQREENFGRHSCGSKHVLIEFSSPNTNKPQHLGHVRNNVLGAAMSNILEAYGHRVTKVNLINDRGIHICKSMLAYMKWGEEKTPENENVKGDHFVGHWYVKYAEEEARQLNTSDESVDNLEITKELQELLRKWEDGDEETISLWKQMNSWVLEGFKETYQTLGIRFDKTYYESDFWEKGKDIVLQGLHVRPETFYKEDNGAIAADLSEHGLGKKILLRGDGTTLYMTQDLATTKAKHDDYDPDVMIWVVGDEQKHHFQVLFKLVEILSHGEPAECHHLAHGMVTLPKGMGKMKSREGRSVDTDDLIHELHHMAFRKMEENFPSIHAGKEERDRALKIALSALKFMILRVNAESGMVYDPEKSVEFTGATGPYLLYSYARIRSIQREMGVLSSTKPDFSALTDPKETALGVLLMQQPEVIKSCAESYNPAPLANHLFNLAQAFSGFYESCHIKRCNNPRLQSARLALINSIGIALKSGLRLLGIDTVEKM